ncbi:Stk1 family PASTA domain-containing Ser/Thr kinase [Clostridiaceae bacterium NSJ-31]|uniref:non-specific serine/threonine protein kinase n=1 Tax=Ligaoa zhengdingensis TaxID=2763658 RepID=A0A926E0U0_9FIRM|nr:Stk1 family PASTA domain-containing Ser/Thr kinase [Ligaoa zhengdingensis]MBC8547543.1 Stk1 family PASTA domain-containing Ser/Thr kinase [Ligaoa zhengdingensis]
MDRYIGRRLDGRYEIIELIGVGGMANVYRARDAAEDRIVAVKILREEYRNNEEFLRRFKNESKAIAILSHPNIVKVYDVMINRQYQYIVMEYIDGISLKEYIEQQGVLKWREAVYFTVQILRGLQHAHERGVVHRDIKPQNIMLLYDGTIKITDFGIARFARAETKTLTDRAIGSVHYISPEQARGDTTDQKADLYSVGVMLFEMLTGKLPFEADSPVSVAIKQIQSIPRRPRELNPEIPEGLEEITLRAMQKDAHRRYQSAAEMLRDINEFKRNPSISFEYKYLYEPEPAEISQAMARQQKVPAARHRAAVPAGRGARSSRPAVDGEPEEVVHKTPVLPILAGVAGAFLLVSGLFIFWMFYTHNPFESVEQVRLPNFVEEKYSTVNQKYGKEFKLEREDVPSNDYERGVIIDQVPKSGRRVRKGSTITLKVSSGSQTVVMEDYAGMAEDEALSKLKSLGLKATTSNINHPNIAKGLVIKTDPPKGSEITTDTPVTVYVSMGAEKRLVPVPDLIGLDKDEARAALTMAGLRVGTITTVTYNQLDPDEFEEEPEIDTVIAQSPDAYGENDTGRMVTEGTMVNFSIYGGDSSVVRLNVRIKLPKLDRKVELRAEMDDELVKKATLNPKDEGEWVVTFSSEYVSEEAKIYIDGELFQKLELDFVHGTHTILRDYTSDFVDDDE